jgi:CBS domain-containing protein
MSRNPVSIGESATLEEAVAFLTDTGFSAAPVIDAAGRPSGVISRTDIVVHFRQRLAQPAEAAYFQKSNLSLPAEFGEAAFRTDHSLVRDLMTPAIFSVAPDASVAAVARQMVHLNVHRLFVVDHAGVLVGVISALDLLGHLCP